MPLHAPPCLGECCRMPGNCLGFTAPTHAAGWQCCSAEEQEQTLGPHWHCGRDPAFLSVPDTHGWVWQDHYAEQALYPSIAEHPSHDSPLAHPTPCQLFSLLLLNLVHLLHYQLFSPQRPTLADSLHCQLFNLQLPNPIPLLANTLLCLQLHNPLRCPHLPNLLLSSRYLLLWPVWVESNLPLHQPLDRWVCPATPSPICPMPCLAFNPSINLAEGSLFPWLGSALGMGGGEGRREM